MSFARRTVLSLLGTALCLASTPAAFAQPTTGILVLAHGGKPEWNERVTALAKTLNADQPTEVAFGMATRANMQGAIDRLTARGVGRIIAVPLFVSSHSSVVTSTAYLLGLRQEMPKDLALFARMSHGPNGHGTATPAASGATASAPAGDHSAHGATPPTAAADGTRPVDSSVPIRMTAALDAHPLVGAIAADRARAISTDPAKEAVVLVAHGPVPDDDNERWLANMAVLATRIKENAPYAAVEYLTVRDDAPKPVRDAAAAELRGVVERHTAQGRRVLIVPLLLSFGGIEQGLRTRLEGLTYVMAAQGIMPDDRIATWVRAMVADGGTATR